MSHQGMDGWYPECEECGMGNCGKMVCLDCYNKLKAKLKVDGNE